MSTVQQSIEAYLLEHGGWVKAEEICSRFDVSERVLRGLNGVPGICSRFAISNTAKGYKHVENATTTEWLRFKHGMRRHGISELVRVSDLDRLRHNVTSSTKRPKLTFEKDTGQAVMFA